MVPDNIGDHLLFNVTSEIRLNRTIPLCDDIFEILFEDIKVAVH